MPTNVQKTAQIRKIEESLTEHIAKLLIDDTTVQNGISEIQDLMGRTTPDYMTENEEERFYSERNELMQRIVSLTAASLYFPVAFETES